MPTARVAHLGPALVTVLLGATPAGIALARGDAVGFASALVLGLAAGAALGWATDDPAAELLASLPVASPTRLALRAAAVGAVVAAVAFGCAAAVAVGPGLPAGWRDLLPEIASAGTIALAVGLIASRRGERAAGSVGVTAGVLAVVVIGGLAFRWPAVFPPLVGGPNHPRWWLVAAVGALATARAGRDPARR